MEGSAKPSRATGRSSAMSGRSSAGGGRAKKKVQTVKSM